MRTLATELRRWQPRINLVASSTIGDIETRHIADSLQFVPMLADRARIVDIGSGGGFPGLVIAACRPEARVHLVETVGKKCAFLRSAVRAMGLDNVTVHHGRIEILAGTLERADAVTARALAPLDRLLDLSVPLLEAQGRCVFAKGQTYEAEIQQASRRWHWANLEIVPSAIGDGAMLVLSGIERQ